MASEKDNGGGSAATPETPKVKPTDKQISLLAIIMQNVEDQPKINVSSSKTLIPPTRCFSPHLPDSDQNIQKKAKRKSNKS